MISLSKLFRHNIPTYATVLALVAGCHGVSARTVRAAPRAASAMPAVADRGLKICVADDAPAPVKQAAQTVLDAAGTQPLLKVLSGANAPTGLTSSGNLSTGELAPRAFNNLVLVGLPTDPLIAAEWQHEANIEEGGLYAFGFGHFKGDIGYIESDRNPWLHSFGVQSAPFETEVVVLTGTSSAGVAAAVSAFLKDGVVNGVVGTPGWSRTKPTLLDRDPLTVDGTFPTWIPATAGGDTLIGLTQSAEDEYRGVLAVTGVEPLEIWRAKYYAPAAWDKAGAAAAISEYMDGLHRRAYGNTLWAARFADAAAASAATLKIADATGVKKGGSHWGGPQPPYGPDPHPGGSLTLWQHGVWVLMSTLPGTPTHDLLALN